MSTPSILFVCTGNICRSPLAEAAFRREAERIGLAVLEIDSAGTGDWHVGDPPDKRAQLVAHAHGLDVSMQRARQVNARDFTRFTHILALDEGHLAQLRRRAPKGSTAEITLLLDHVAGRAGHSVADPYSGDMRDFETTLKDVTAGAEGLARALAERG